MFYDGSDNGASWVLKRRALPNLVVLVGCRCREQGDKVKPPNTKALGPTQDVLVVGQQVKRLCLWEAAYN
jgi:hypothetical protein